MTEPAVQARKISAFLVRVGQARRFLERGDRFSLRTVVAAAMLSALMTCSAIAQVGAGPIATPLPPALPTPMDAPFRGTIQLAVNATDTDHQIYSVHETIPVQTPGDTVLLYPEWETASHAPTATVAELAGLIVQVDGKPAEWARDPVDMHAFHVKVPNGASSITLDFQFLAPASANLLRPDMAMVPWHRVLLYPAGWYVRNIPVTATLTLPRGLTPYTALAFETNDTDELRFQPVMLDRLVDAPVYAGRFTRRILLNGDAAKPVALDMLADAKEDLAIRPSEIELTKRLILQSQKTFGTAPYRHYDIMVTLSDVLSPDGGGGGVEHLEEGENNLPAAYFTRAAEQLNNRDLIAHEYAHVWNGLWREPANLWSPTFNRPVDGSLLWVYEGQTEFWGRMMAARAGLRDHQQTLDKLAMDAANVARRSGRRWKDLQDSTNDAIYMAKRHIAWRDWQRREDYYPEGVLLWLDVDARLRELSHGKRSLDDFARLFFATDSTRSTKTYTFQNVCDALNQVSPDDWAAFLNRHLLSHSTEDAIAGLARAGWKLTFNDTPTETFLQDEKGAGAINLDDSIGLQVGEDGRIQSVQWDSPAFQAGLSPGVRITDVGGEAFSTRALIGAVQSSPSKPISLSVKMGGNPRTVAIDYHGGLRYPHLERIDGTPDRLSDLLKAR
ncbi:M61 family peptidase [Dyella solisilvae]|uniref:M61 family peptidase n=1 Tax=Dyella solisilvae TaxID=1920168 RepID=A0A370K9R9_9GAMM|nr:M61 family metallopeptidase [Dyella solisilvae]RDI99398.1 M61 family peptidase [Dyella solisilvae]